MKHFINPAIDCVFKAILGSEENIHLLIQFLNGILAPLCPITTVEILNPYNERDFTTDKLSIVDVKARDDEGRTYQIEVQLKTPEYLQNRILYTWCRVYQNQLKKGKKFDKLTPVISIWLLTENLDNESSQYHHHYELRDIRDNHLLTDHLAIHVIELKKWQEPANQSPQQLLPTKHIWLKLFKEGKNFKYLPDNMKTPEMEDVMTILERFSEQERDYHLYHDREDFIMEQATKDSMLKEAQAEIEQVKAQARAETKQLKAKARAEAEKAEDEIARLKKLLADKK